MLARVKKICIAIVIGFTILCILVLLFLFLMMFQMEWNNAHSIGNPYINARYSGWKSVHVDEVVRVKFPREWDLVSEDDRYKIMDYEGHCLAMGKLICGSEPSSDFFQELYHSEIDSRTAVRQHSSFSERHNSDCYKLVTAFSSGKTCEFVLVWLNSQPHDITDEYLFIFFQPDGEVDPDVYEKAEAMAWSVEYGNDELCFLEQKALHLR